MDSKEKSYKLQLMFEEYKYRHELFWKFNGRFIYFMAFVFFSYFILEKMGVKSDVIKSNPHIYIYFSIVIFLIGVAGSLLNNYEYAYLTSLTGTYIDLKRAEGIFKDVNSIKSPFKKSWLIPFVSSLFFTFLLYVLNGSNIKTIILIETIYIIIFTVTICWFKKPKRTYLDQVKDLINKINNESELDKIIIEIEEQKNKLNENK